MNSRPDLSPDPLTQFPGPTAPDVSNGQPPAIPEEMLSAEDSAPAAPKKPKLLDSFYHWVMSRM